MPASLVQRIGGRGLAFAPRNGYPCRVASDEAHGSACSGAVLRGREFARIGQDSTHLRIHHPHLEGVRDMAAVCDVCAKGPGFGKSVSHSHRRTNRRWNPNIQTVRAEVAPGNTRKLNVCTSCLKAGKVARA
ncbi:50S ribosomal protein L28 [Rhodococcus rhodnii LMG 5362]|uniref:Large ribosomal subunit protein bL28 n=2 Tax=Rhodococcus rhodnii TaxID=38312 RepID=R7WIN1_9NOCA|nr:50S ribosomal protein L28 [Rhodococcus rhodnii LMG 5362]